MILKVRQNNLKAVVKEYQDVWLLTTYKGHFFGVGGVGFYLWSVYWEDIFSEWKKAYDEALIYIGSK